MYTGADEVGAAGDDVLAREVDVAVTWSDVVSESTLLLTLLVLRSG